MAIGTISWRRFLILLNGLSPNSIVATALQVREHERTQGKEVIEDPLEAEKYVWDVFK